MKSPVTLFAMLFAAVATTSACTGLPFHPVKEVTRTPAAIGLAYEDLLLDTADGERIAAWFIPAAAGPRPQRAGTLLFFHGNAGNMSHRLESIRIFHELGLDTFIIDYRGFGGSTGKASVKGTLQDARAAWDWLREHKGRSPEDLVIFGRSLGGGVAADLAAEVRPSALILESTFTSLYDVAKDWFPNLPVGLFLPQDYDTPGRLAGLRVPLLTAHSPEDEVVSFRLGKALYESYSGPKTFLKMRGSHNNGFRESGTAYTDALRVFLRRAQTGRSACAHFPASS
jgi:fermentation-respiration switch protein FrsA (DUF1100 family)